MMMERQMLRMIGKGEDDKNNVNAKMADISQQKYEKTVKCLCFKEINPV